MLASWNTTNNCNLKCEHCYRDAGNESRGELTTEEGFRLLDEIAKAGFKLMVFSGGEPFMRDDLPVLLEGIVRGRMRYSILSNGGFINHEMAAFMAETGRCDQVQISVDGSRPETHDAGRGAGSFEGALRGIRILQAHAVPIGVRVTLHRHNITDIEAITRLLLDDLGLKSFSTNTAGYLGSCRKNAGEVLLSVQQRQRAMADLANMATKYDGRIMAMAGPLAEARLWDRMEAAMTQRAPPFPEGGYLTGCGGSNYKIAVRADGAIIPCTMLPHLETGRINRDSLAEGWWKSPVLKRMRARRTIPLERFEFCNGCAYLPYCTGSCAGLAYSLTGEVDHPSPNACLRRFLDEGGELELGRIGEISS